MNILFRVDAGGKTGLGHFYRSLNLANELQKRNHTVFFAYKDTIFWQILIKNGFHFLTFKIEEDSEEIQLLKLINLNEIKIFYVDGLIDFDKVFIDKVKEKAKVVFYQNITKSKELADVFILPSVHHDESFLKSLEENTQLFQGLKYFTFHPAITEMQKKPFKSGKVRDIAIIAGGSDPNNTIKTIYNLLDYNQFNEIRFTFFYGEDYIHEIPETDSIYIYFKLFNHKEILENDLLISAFGVSTYEFLSLGMPVIAFGHQASNALASDIMAKKTNAIVNLGHIKDLDSKALNNTLLELVNNEDLRELMILNASKVLNHEGVQRVADIVEQNIKK